MSRTEHARDRLIVALDTDGATARALAGELEGVVSWLKVGMTLFYREGPAVVTELRARGFRVFLDLKLHDIPHQVEGAAESVARLGAGMLTVHASGGSAMIAAAVRGAARGAEQAGLTAPAVLGVTVLTSTDDQGLLETGVSRTAAEQVPLLADLSIRAGAQGVVCSPQEAAALRDALGAQALIVTPGVRPEWAGHDDQARVATPEEALRAGASHLVVGRPITAAARPSEAAQRIMDLMESR